MAPAAPRAASRLSAFSLVAMLCFQSDVAYLKKSGQIARLVSTSLAASQDLAIDCMTTKLLARKPPCGSPPDARHRRSPYSPWRICHQTDDIAPLIALIKHLFARYVSTRASATPGPMPHSHTVTACWTDICHCAALYLFMQHDLVVALHRKCSPFAHHVNPTEFYPGAPTVRIVSSHASARKNPSVFLPSAQQESCVGAFGMSGLRQVLRPEPFPSQLSTWTWHILDDASYFVHPQTCCAGKLMGNVHIFCSFLAPRI